MLIELINLRHELHQFPELSGSEKNTADRIESFIQSHEPNQIIKGIGGHGLAAVYEFGSNGPCIAIRCELDALPIQEPNDFEYQSTSQNVSHKCGHDGHMTIVAGLAPWLSKESFSLGKVVLLFQPAEETGQGAYQVLEDQRIQDLNIDFFFALHNIPGAPLHSVLVCEEGFSAEVISLAITLKGKEAHASEPENGINPTNVIAHIIDSLAQLNQPDTLSSDFAILTPVHVNLGQKAYGISPGHGELHYTIRTWNPETMEKLKSEINWQIETACRENSLAFEINWLEYFPASINDKSCLDQVIAAANENNLPLQKMPAPFRFGEDFGWYSKKHKTAMFGLGAGESHAALHHADYDFPDELIPSGIKMFKTIITNILTAQPI